MGFLYSIFGSIISFIYQFVNNYGVTIILFTIIAKLLTLPLSIKQVKSMSRMQLLQPEIAKISEKYKNDKEMLQTETMKLYSKYKVNPMSGCLPMLIQFPIIICMYKVIYKPLTYVVGMSEELITKLGGIVNGILGEGNLINLEDPMMEITLAQKWFENGQAVTATASEFAQFNPINFSFGPFSLAATPKIGVISWYWIFPILVFLTTYLSSKLTQKQQPAGDPNNQAAQTANTMTWMMPIMTGWFSFIMPAAMSVYWIVSTLFQMVQQILLNKKYLNDNLKSGFVEQVETEMEAERKAKKRRKKK